LMVKTPKVPFLITESTALTQNLGLKVVQSHRKWSSIPPLLQHF